MKSSKIFLSIIMPVYNEAKTIKQIVGVVDRVKINNPNGKVLAKELIIVDDGSTDGTLEVLKQIEKCSYSMKVQVILQEKNQGKGSAVRRGITEVQGKWTIIQDADLEYNPEDYNVLLKPAFRKVADVVYGSRFTGEHRNMYYWHLVGNKFLSFVTNILYNTTISDMETCYKLIDTDILKKLNLRSNKFDIEPEITAKILKQGIRIYEVPISYSGREINEGKKISWKDGIGALWTIIKYKFIN